MTETDYRALTISSLPSRLKSTDTIVHRLGSNTETWEVTEVGDGNLNLVFVVTSDQGTIVVKQALPYVRLVGDSWPLPLSRAFFEHEALVRQNERDPGSVPGIYHFDREQAIIAMEMLQPHIILRKKLIAGEKVQNLAETLGQFCARTAFRGSDLSLPTQEKKRDVALFQGNHALMAITEDLVFTDPFFNAEKNHHTPLLEGLVNELRSDAKLKTEAQRLLCKFTANAETLLHGDLHTGSVMCTDSETKVIDPEFAFYGPMGFDLGMLIANFLMAYFSQPAHRKVSDLTDYQEWILETIVSIHRTFEAEFKELWASERSGILYPHSLFEDQGQSSDIALQLTLDQVWEDALGICGIEMHRRVLSLAHNEDFEAIENIELKAKLESANLKMGRHIILQRTNVSDVTSLVELARRFNDGG